MKFLSIATFVLLLFACCGWGYVLTRWTTWSEKNNFALMSVVGIGCLIFIGGVLNLLRLAVPLAMDILLLAGLVFFVICYSARVRNWLVARRTAGIADRATAPGTALDFLPLAILIIATGFYALTLLPAEAFNISDDFYTYVLRPVRMLQTGTLAGNPYEMLGLDSLGANAFLQGFVLLGFPIQYLLGFDAVFSFALAGLLLVALGRKFNLHWIYPLLAVLTFIVIDPQSVNISAIYISAALILGIFFASCMLLDHMDAADSANQKIAAISLGLLFAGLIGLKVTFVAYSLAYFAVFFAGLLWLAPDRKKVLKLCGLTLLSLLLALLPWLALFADNYAAAIRLALHHAATAADSNFSVPKGNVAALFSSADLFYGGSFLSYGLIVLFLMLIAIFSFVDLRFGGGASPRNRYLLVAAAACLAGTVSYLFNGLLFNPDLAVRYSCPVLIASFPFVLLAAASALPDSLRLSGLVNLAGLKLAVVAGMPILLIVLFWNDFMTRVERAYTQHESISFDLNEQYLAYNRYVVSPEARELMRSIQSRTEPGQKIFAWVSMPIDLDFARNEIYTLREPSLLNPWLDLPYTGNARDMVHYLKGQGVRYIMWEYNGYGMPTEDKVRKMLSFPYLVYRKIGQRSLYLRKVLTAMMQGGVFLYYSNNIVLFDLQQISD